MHALSPLRRTPEPGALGADLLGHEGPRVPEARPALSVAFGVLPGAAVEHRDGPNASLPVVTGAIARGRGALFGDPDGIY